MTPVASLPAAGRELDALIAECVFGLVRCQGEKHDRDYPNTFCYAQPESPTQGAEARGYSTEIASAWEVVEKLQHGGPRKRYWWSLETPWIEPPQLCVARILEGSVEIARGEAPTMAESICVAALKAVAP